MCLHLPLFMFLIYLIGFPLSCPLLLCLLSYPWRRTSPTRKQTEDESIMNRIGSMNLPIKAKAKAKAEAEADRQADRAETTKRQAGAEVEAD